MPAIRNAKTFIAIVITLLGAQWLTPALRCESTAVAIARDSAEPRNAARTGDAEKHRAANALDKLPLRFEENQRQANYGSKFIARAAGFDFSIVPTEAVMHLHAMEKSTATPLTRIGAEREGAKNTLPASPTPRNTASLRLQLVSANRHARVIGENQLTTRTNYFIGNDATQWNRNVPNYARVRVEQIYRGVDVVYYGSSQQLEYDFNVAPGAAYKAIRLRFSGAQRMAIDRSGDLVIDTTAGRIRQHRPVAYQLINGSRKEIPARYVVRGKCEVRFLVEQYDERLPLVIDPVLTYSTYFGGQGWDMAHGVAVDAAGNVYITGPTYSSDLPLKGAVPPATSQINGNVFIAKFNASGTELIYSTIVGGDGLDVGAGIAVDSAGNACVTGPTYSTDFPTTPGAFQSALAGGGSSDAFVVKLNAEGSGLSYSTYLGGGGASTFASSDTAYAIALDSLGNAYVTGRTDSTDFPTTPGAIQRTRKSLPDAFVTKLNATGTALVYSTYLGGSSADEGIGIAADAAGNAYVTGYTSSADFPVTAGALQTELGRDSRVPLVMHDAFVTKINTDGSALIYSTYLGGFRFDIGSAIAVDAEGNAYVGGATQSSNFPTTTGSAKPEYEGGFFRSGNGGQGWRMRNTGLTVPFLRGIAVDPKTPSTLYLSTDEGLYKSTDGGNSWTRASTFVFSDLVIDPVNPLTLYAGYGGVNKSTDGGLTWVAAGNGLPTQFYARQLLIDRLDPATLYVSGLGFSYFTNQESGTAAPSLEDPPPPPPHFFFKSTDAGASWQEIRSLNLFNTPAAVAMDPQDPSRLFVNTSGHLYRTQNGGGSWRLMNDNAPYDLLAGDPKTAGTLYGGGAGVAKSTDDGQTFAAINSGLPKQFVPLSLVAIPTTPTTLYAASGLGVFKSTDAGASWKESALTGPAAVVAFNPLDPSIVYAGVNDPNDAFVAKLNSTGSALLYCTYLGGGNDDHVQAIAVDSAGNAYVTGTTFSNTFTTQRALQTDKLAALYTAFVTKLNGAGSELLFSTYFGGSNDITAGQGIALSPAGDVYVAGWTASRDIPIQAALQAAFSGGEFDGFLFKLGAPRITSVSISGKQLTVKGENFDQGATLLINGEDQNTRNDDASPSTILIGKKAGKRIPSGQTGRIRVRNSDATLSNEFNFVRSAE